MYIHTYIYIYIHTYIYVYMYKYIRACTQNTDVRARNRMTRYFMSNSFHFVCMCFALSYMYVYSIFIYIYIYINFNWHIIFYHIYASWKPAPEDPRPVRRFTPRLPIEKTFFRLLFFFTSLFLRICTRKLNCQACQAQKYTTIWLLTSST